MFNNKKIKKLEQQVKYLTHIIENPLKFKKGDKLFYLNESNEFKEVIITDGCVRIISWETEKEYEYINFYGYYAENKLFTKEQLKKM